MKINGITIDTARGFDVMRGNKVLEHFTDYAEAKKYMLQVNGRYMRYWAVKSA